MELAIKRRKRRQKPAVLQTWPIRMSPSAFRDFMSATAQPARVVPEMLELRQRKAPWETGGRNG
jgi:uncharacterized protein (DUF1778 family)